MTDITTITTITSITSCAADLFTLISRDTPLRRTAATNGGEYSAPCPLCRRGTDHFKYWRGTTPGGERWACLGPKAGRSGCDKGGDAIQYLRDRDHLTYPEACARLGIAPAQASGAQASVRLHLLPERLRRTSCPSPPSHRHHPSGRPAPPNSPPAAPSSSGKTKAPVPSPTSTPAASHDATLRAFHVGYNPEDLHDDHAAWGLPPPARSAPARIWLPRGITFPWYVDDPARAWDLASQHPPPPQPRADRPRRAQVPRPAAASPTPSTTPAPSAPTPRTPCPPSSSKANSTPSPSSRPPAISSPPSPPVPPPAPAASSGSPVSPRPRASSSPSTSTWAPTAPRGRRRRLRLVAGRPPACPPLAPPPPRRQLRPGARRRPCLDPVRSKPLTDRSHSPCPPSPTNPPATSAHYTRRDGTIDSFHLRATRSPRFPLMNQLSARQVAQFQSLAAIYRADLLDPAAWEALLLLLEICNILDLLPTVIERIFGEGIRDARRNLERRDPPAPPPIAGRRRASVAPGSGSPTNPARASIPSTTPVLSGSTTSTIPRPSREADLHAVPCAGPPAATFAPTCWNIAV